MGQSPCLCMVFPTRHTVGTVWPMGWHRRAILWCGRGFAGTPPVQSAQALLMIRSMPGLTCWPGDIYFKGVRFTWWGMIGVPWLVWPPRPQIHRPGQHSACWPFRHFKKWKGLGDYCPSSWYFLLTCSKCNPPLRQPGWWTTSLVEFGLSGTVGPRAGNMQSPRFNPCSMHSQIRG